VGEFVPLIFGLAAGALAGSITPRVPLLRWGALCVLLGVAATAINGELEDEPWLVLFDIAQVAVAFALTVVVARAVAQRRRDR
jgi:hypothetical protein